MKKRMLILNEKDNVGVVLENFDIGDSSTYNNVDVTAVDEIEFGHKIALKDIAKEESIYKYGEEIGYATKDIKKGNWVHVHNMSCRRGK